MYSSQVSTSRQPDPLDLFLNSCAVSNANDVVSPYRSVDKPGVRHECARIASFNSSVHIICSGSITTKMWGQKSPSNLNEFSPKLTYLNSQNELYSPAKCIEYKVLVPGWIFSMPIRWMNDKFKFKLSYK